ncbi:hypothetical protein C0J52_00167 [Blattella germanica]|nr:hypothetical protein C0J52_00167 [Blattella germanica]
MVKMEFDSVWVSTDGIDIGKEASSVGAQVHWRSAETATDSAPSIWGVQEFSSLHPEIDVVALVQCTSPFLRTSFLEKAYNMMQGGSFDSVFSATREHKLRWRNLRDGTVEPINFNPKKRPRRQDWEGELVENGMFYFAKKKLIAEGLLQGGRTGVVEIPKNCSNEIDSIFDLEIAAAQVDAQLSTTNYDGSYFAGSVPPYYREVYDIISPTSSTISKDLLTKLLVKSGLPAQTLSSIWELVDTKQGSLSRSSLYKALALVAWAQQGKQPSTKLLENFSGEGDYNVLDLYVCRNKLPRPELGDLSDIAPLPMKNPTQLGLSYPDICQIDTIEVDLVPEKKGLFLKHVEYQVASKRFSSLVRRRYNDFVALHELLLGRFPYRLIPKLPPKKMVGADSQFIEERRKSLRRWLTLVARHPALYSDPLLSFFLTYTGAEELVPPDTHSEFANSRDQIRVILNGISRLKQIADVLAMRSHGEFGLLSTKAMQQAVREEDEVCERLNLLLDILVAHRELCERHEKGVAQDHSKALSKMLSLKKRQMQGVIRGTDMADVWRLIQPTVVKCLPENNQQLPVNGNSPLPEK